MIRRAATFLLALGGCAHLEFPTPTRPRGTVVLALMADGSRLSGELVGADAAVIVLADAVSDTHFTCLGRSSLSSVATVEGQTVIFPFIGLGPSSPLAMMPIATPKQGPAIAAELEELRAQARYADEIPAPILKRCARR